MKFKLLNTVTYNGFVTPVMIDLEKVKTIHKESNKLVIDGTAFLCSSTTVCNDYFNAIKMAVNAT